MSSVGQSSAFSSSASSHPSPTLLTLPGILLSYVCSYLTPKQVLVTLALTAKTTREVLTPACFSSHSLELGLRELLHLCTFDPPRSSTVCSFHSRVLSDSHLTVDISSRDITVQRVLDSLDHFPTCNTLRLHCDSKRWRHLTTVDLLSLLYHPTTISCSGLQLDYFQQRERTKLDPHTASFDWTTVCLQSVCRLRLHFHGSLPHVGFGLFLTAHAAIMHLDVSTAVVPIHELTCIFQSPDALPHLTRLSVHSGGREVQEAECDLPSLVTALATTVMGASGGQRPMQWLELHIRTPPNVFAAASLMPGLSRLQLLVKPPWMTDWARTPGMVDALPLLQECIVRADEPVVNEDVGTGKGGVLVFFQSMASRAIQRLSVLTGELVSFDVAIMAQLARCDQLRELQLGVSDRKDVKRTAWMDWTDAALPSAFTANGCPFLRSVRLNTVRLSAELVLAVTSASPQLREVSLDPCELTCHPAVILAIVGGCCEHIESIDVREAASHLWSNVQATDIRAAYQSAVATAGRGDGYKPFVRLRRLHATMCWCTPPSAWHALLSLLKWATRLQCVSRVASNDPLVIAGLSHPPSLSALGNRCLWPLSFSTFMGRWKKRANRYHYLTCGALSSGPDARCHALSTPFELTDAVDVVGQVTQSAHPTCLRLRPGTQLFRSFRRSLSNDHRDVLARWDMHNFCAGDDQLNAAESPLDWPGEDSVDCRQACPHPHFFYSRRALPPPTYTTVATADDSKADVKVEESVVEDEEMHIEPLL